MDFDTNTNEVIYVAERVGDQYRGEVIHAKTYSTLLKTAHTYPNETIAKVAARRTWAERMPVAA